MSISSEDTIAFSEATARIPRVSIAVARLPSLFQDDMSISAEDTIAFSARVEHGCSATATIPREPDRSPQDKPATRSFGRCRRYFKTICPYLLKIRLCSLPGSKSAGQACCTVARLPSLFQDDMSISSEDTIVFTARVEVRRTSLLHGCSAATPISRRYVHIL